MEDMLSFLTTWGPPIGIFCITGTLMKALQMTINGKAGDKGFKGVWYVWKRVFLLPIGALLGLLGGMIGLLSPTGTGLGYSVLDGVVAAFVAGQAYDLIINTARARLAHQLAKGASKKA